MSADFVTPEGRNGTTPSSSLVEDGCQVTVRPSDRWSRSHPCGRPVERDGKCKMHLRVEENRSAKDRERREKWERGNALQTEADALGAAFGSHVEANYNSIKGEYDGRFIVDGDWLRAQVKE